MILQKGYWKRRILLIERMVFLSWGILLTGVFYLQILKGNYYYYLSEKNFIRLVSIPAPRGEILDRKMRVLAMNRLSFDIAVSPALTKNSKVFSVLARILNVSEKELRRRYKRNWIAPFVPVVIAKDVSKQVAIYVAELKMKYPQIEIVKRTVRVYPYGPVTSHILGYVRKIDTKRLKSWKRYGYSRRDEVGYMGLEESYNAYLEGENGWKKIAVDKMGRFVKLLSDKIPEKGKSLILNIDMQLQNIVYTHLKGKVGAVIIMDPFTGEVLAMCSMPSYDNNLFVSSKEWKKRLLVLNNPNSPMLNRAISGMYPPGSTFKVVSSFAGMDSGVINESTRFYCDGVLKVGGVSFGCSHIHKDENLVEAIAHSCNVFFYNVALRMGVRPLLYWAKRFGFGVKTKIDIPGEKEGLLPSPQWKKRRFHLPWFTGDTLNLSIGQGYLMATPIQVLRMMAAVANGGFLVRPYLCKYVGGYEINYPQLVPLDLPSDILLAVRNGLRFAVEYPDGTAYVLSGLPVSVAGKTGTAQSVKGKPSHSWFVGFFPVDNPKYVAVVLLEFGGSSYNACELLREIILEMKENGLLND